MTEGRIALRSVMTVALGALCWITTLTRGQSVSPVHAGECLEGQRPCFVSIHRDFAPQAPVEEVSGFWYEPPTGRPSKGVTRHFIRLVSGQEQPAARPPILVEFGFISPSGGAPVIYSLCARCFARNPEGPPAGWNPFGNHGSPPAYPVEFRIAHDIANMRTVWFINDTVVRTEEKTGFQFGARVSVGVYTDAPTNDIGEFWTNDILLYVGNRGFEAFVPNRGHNLENIGYDRRRIVYMDNGTVSVDSSKEPEGSQ